MEPKSELCWGPSPQPLFPSFSLHPAHIEPCLLSFEVLLIKGIDDCQSTQPEMKDAQSPTASQPCTQRRGPL